jgi:hypothetical protein
MKRFILLITIIAITAMAFTACTKKSERTEGSTQSQTSTAEQTQTATEVQTSSNRLLANRNVSEFAGTWVTSQGQSMQIRANGMLAEIAGSKYIAYFADDFEADVYIIPKGIEFIHWTGAIQTDTTQDRVFIQYASERVPTNDDVYYRVGEAASQSKVWEPAELTGEWHSRSITASCHGQEHYIFTADGYYKKGDLYSKHDGTWSLLIDARGKYNLTLQFKQFIDFESGWSPNEFTENSEYETIDPNNIDLLIHGTGWIELTRCNNPGWNAQ